ncbi:hypothetical protein GCM10011360_08980 [Primorskyibacter flagellatus]|uniref:DUF1697 domain-containing protein n=1 Tax=Primorskyibacter flagellatus TaxID=1387277 RepID=A0A917A244_9RHOB|nr:DUF1697 domain-containing protein [Primorskyibacter flagellatus]GGE22701.1 hypothetical protein GCM10011360_08980 [Primorskyibacter flagellatus]
MTRWIVLLRGVNVGGHGKLPMAELRAALTKAGAEDVATYIQSGNIVMSLPETVAAKVADWTSDLIAQTFGHRPAALAWTKPDFAGFIHANPYPAPETPKFLHFHLFSGTPAGDALEKLRPLLYPGEEMTLTPNCLYHWPPAGYGRSKVAEWVPRALGVPTTARNLNSMRAILELA